MRFVWYTVAWSSSVFPKAVDVFVDSLPPALARHTTIGAGVRSGHGVPRSYTRAMDYAEEMMSCTPPLLVLSDDQTLPPASVNGPLLLPVSIRTTAGL